MSQPISKVSILITTADGKEVYILAKPSNLSDHVVEAHVQSGVNREDFADLHIPDLNQIIELVQNEAQQSVALRH